MAVDGITNSNRVDATTERKLYAKVVDGVGNSRSYFARAMGKAKPFVGKSMDVSIKYQNSNTFEWFTGLEALNSAASDNTITLSFRHAAGTQPVVSIMVESFANQGEAGTIDLDDYKYEEAVMEAVQAVGTKTFSGLGAANDILGLEAIVDDGSNVGTIGGKLRSSYDTLDATVTASSGTLTLAKMATLHSAISAGGVVASEPNIMVTTKTIWDLVEQLLHPTLRNNYSTLPVRGDNLEKGDGLKGMAGFRAITWRGIPIIRDDACTSGVLYMLNEKTFAWHGRTSVPEAYRGELEKVSLGTASAMEGTGIDTLPSEWNGWFYKPMQMLPNQAGMVARLFLIGNFVPKEFRRNGKLTGITGV
jgi:hypothetical protein